MYLCIFDKCHLTYILLQIILHESIQKYISHPPLILNLALLQRPSNPLHLDGDWQLHPAVLGPVVLAEALPAPVVALELGAGYEEDVRLVDALFAPLAPLAVDDVLHGPDRPFESPEGRSAKVRGQPHGRTVPLGQPGGGGRSLDPRLQCSTVTFWILIRI